MPGVIIGPNGSPLSGQIYFIQVMTNGPIKIGFTALSIERRLVELQVACPYELRLIAIRNGTLENELALHQTFSAIRLRGEWFQAAAELMHFIRRLHHKNFSWPTGPRPPLLRCSRCGGPHDRPKQRWCRACRADYMRARRYETACAIHGVPRETLDSTYRDRLLPPSAVPPADG